ELENRLEVLLAHILKRVYVNSDYDNRGWILTIGEQRRRIRRLLKSSPSLKNHFSECFTEIFQDASEAVRPEYPEIEFPDGWQFSRDIDAILNAAFWED
ncbi:DUF29 domain-containing protein, partial [Pseudanabaenaceae cyanobacterium LEGE 13415]|nr:DUF29 domain-containing protein [Pseudanabaenaceae cyanobacterium LEGE 13415]